MKIRFNSIDSKRNFSTNGTDISKLSCYHFSARASSNPNLSKPAVIIIDSSASNSSLSPNHFKSASAVLQPKLMKQKIAITPTMVKELEPIQENVKEISVLNETMKNKLKDENNLHLNKSLVNMKEKEKSQEQVLIKPLPEFHEHSLFEMVNNKKKDIHYDNDTEIFMFSKSFSFYSHTKCYKQEQIWKYLTNPYLTNKSGLNSLFR